MNIKEYRILFITISIGMILVITLAFFSAAFPYPATAERFLMLGLLGKGKTAADYYPNNDPGIQVLEEVPWHVFVQNFMGEAEYVSVKVKILNSTMMLPDTVTCRPSNEESIFDIKLFLADTQSITIPFVWYVAALSVQEESITLTRLVINNVSCNVNVRSARGSSFHMIFEAWHYDRNVGQLRFKCTSSLGVRCTWTQMVFNAVVA